MKKTKVWLRWIALTLLVILCINSVGSIALASEIQEEGYDSEAELLEEKSSTEADYDQAMEIYHEAEPVSFSYGADGVL